MESSSINVPPGDALSQTVISIFYKKYKLNHKGFEFSIPFICAHADIVSLRYFEPLLFDITEIIVWNIRGLRHCVAKI